MVKKSNSELSFKFNYVKNGHAQGFWAKQGKATEEAILLEDERLIYEDLADSTTRDNRLILAMSSQACLSKKMAKNLSDNSILVLDIHGIETLTLERWRDRISSKKMVELKRKELIAKGEESLFHSATCPHCGATIDLSGLNRSSYIYCRYCETVFKEIKGIVTKGEDYHPCDECQMFDRVQGYTEFYFYFLLVVYGYYSKRRFLCVTCADKLFWKMLLINFIFVIGIIPSIMVKIQSLRGRDPALKNLGKANAFAKQGNYQKASIYYKQCYKTYPDHPGLLMNEGIGHLLGGDDKGAVFIFQRSLQSCANYYPTIQLVEKLRSQAQA